MRFTFPINFAEVLIEAERSVAAIEPDEATMRKRGFVMVRRKNGRVFWRRNHDRRGNEMNSTDRRAARA